MKTSFAEAAENTVADKLQTDFAASNDETKVEFYCCLENVPSATAHKDALDGLYDQTLNHWSQSLTFMDAFI